MEMAEVHLEPVMDTGETFPLPDSSDVTAGLFNRLLGYLGTSHLHIAQTLRVGVLELFCLQLSGVLLSILFSCSGTDVCVPAFTNAMRHLSSFADLLGQLELFHS